MRSSRPKYGFGQGGAGVMKHTFLTKYFMLHTNLSTFGDDMCKFQVKESIYRGFEKIGPSVLVKMAILCQI